MQKLLIIIVSLYTCLFADVYATYEVKAVKEASLNMVTQGIVSAVYVDVGSNVTKNELLLSIHDKEEKATLEMTKSEYQFLVAQYKRYENSSEVFDKNTLEKLRSELERAKNALLLNEEKVAKMKLIAPFAGVISEKNIEIGDMTATGGKPIFKLVSHEKKLLLAFDSHFASDVHVGNSFCFNNNAKETQPMCTRIIKIYPVVHTETKKLYAETNGVDLTIGTFGDGMIQAN